MADKLLDEFDKLDGICEAVAAFWTIEANRFDSQGAKLKTGQATQLKSQSKTLREKAIENNVQFWTKARDDVKHYAAAMSAINDSFNFQTEVKPLTTRDRLLDPTFDF